MALVCFVRFPLQGRASAEAERAGPSGIRRVADFRRPLLPLPSTAAGCVVGERPRREASERSSSLFSAALEEGEPLFYFLN